MARLGKNLTEYSRIPNKLVNDKNISLKAKGLFAYMEGKPVDWEFSVRKLSLCLKESSDSIASGLKELEDSGYLVRNKVQDNQGYWQVHYILQDGTMVHENPVLENPSKENPVSGKTPNIIIKNKQKKEVTNKEINTNVLAKASKYGKPEINDCFLKWKEIVGYPITSKTAANRNACNNLIRKHTVEGVERLIRGVAKTQEDKFAPRISDFITLQAKQNDLLAWGKRKLTGEVKGVIRV